MSPKSSGQAVTSHLLSSVAFILMIMNKPLRVTEVDFFQDCEHFTANQRRTRQHTFFICNLTCNWLHNQAHKYFSYNLYNGFE